MTSTDSDNPIEAVRARLDGGRKWHKGALFHTDRDGFWDESRACLMGASHRAVPEVRDWVDSIVLEVAREQFPGRAEGGDKHPLANFNDHPDTTWADVDLVLDKAARRWDEQVSE